MTVPRKETLMHACIVCGRKQNVRTHKLPHGTIHVCPSLACSQKLSLKLDRAIPIVWLGMDDVYSHFVDVDDAKFTKEEAKSLEPYLHDGAEEMVNFLWDTCGETAGELFHNGIVEAVVEMERQKILSATSDQLLFMIGRLKFPEENSKFLEQRLKEMK